MTIRETPKDITSYWLVSNSDENRILQENSVFPRYMDGKYCYYTLDKHFVDIYLKLINENILIERKNEFNILIRKEKNCE